MRELAEDALITVTHSDVRLPSPVNAPLAIDLMQLHRRELRNKMRESQHDMIFTMSHRDVRLPSPVNVPLAIDVTLF